MTSLEVEEEKSQGKKALQQRIGSTRKEISLRRLDVGIGTLFSNVVMFFIILTTAMTRHPKWVSPITETSTQVAKALEPLAGKFAYLLPLRQNLLGVGFLCAFPLTGSAAYALAETFHWKQGLIKP